jgi:hypothetical protein
VGSKRASALMKQRRNELRSFLSSQPYNAFIVGGYVEILPVVAQTFYTLSCGDKGIIKPDTLPSGVVFKDGSFLNIYEKWSVEEDQLLEYTYHYQVPHGISIRYDKDPERASPAHPEHHLQTSAIGNKIRLPTGEIRCEEVLQMIFEQFLIPNQP